MCEAVVFGQKPEFQWARDSQCFMNIVPLMLVSFHYDGQCSRYLMHFTKLALCEEA